jgi:predicted DCC family thiol-disulfide oxidoreductase YuxK
MPNADDILLVYDKECPVCDYYCRKIDVGGLAGRLVHINAREESEIMAEITALGLDIDEGMVVKIGEDLYYDSAAINKLALLSSGNGFFNRMTIVAFGWPPMARVLYPILKLCRKLLLKMLGRSKVNNLNRPGNERF